MANAKGKSIDSTYLRIAADTSRKGYIHRDYLAHCLRYSHVAKYMMEGKKHLTAHVLDVGCGREAPLARLLFSMMMVHSTGTYTGVDYGPIPWPETIKRDTDRFNATFHEKTDFTSFEPKRKAYDVITSFEVLEHVEAEHAFRMMTKMRSLLAKNGRCFLSTPCYDPKVGAADNHVNEMSHLGFKALIVLAGFEIESVWGTFASQRDYKQLMTAGQREVFEKLSDYYDSGVLACFMAPMFPEQARNCIWQLKPNGDRQSFNVTVGQSWDQIGKRLATSEHGSSALWPKQLKQIIKESV